MIEKIAGIGKLQFKHVITTNLFKTILFDKWRKKSKIFEQHKTQVPCMQHLYFKRGKLSFKPSH